MHKLFQTLEDVSPEVMLAYAKDELSPAERHQLELLMLDYPYLADTVEGLEMLIKEGEDPAALLLSMGPVVGSSSDKKQPKKWAWVRYAAAAAVMGIGLWTVWVNQERAPESAQLSELTDTDSSGVDEQPEQVEEKSFANEVRKPELKLDESEPVEFNNDQLADGNKPTPVAKDVDKRAKNLREEKKVENKQVEIPVAEEMELAMVEAPEEELFFDAQEDDSEHAAEPVPPALTMDDPKPALAGTLAQTNRLADKDEKRLRETEERNDYGLVQEVDELNKELEQRDQEKFKEDLADVVVTAPEKKEELTISNKEIQKLSAVEISAESRRVRFGKTKSQEGNKSNNENNDQEYRKALSFRDNGEYDKALPHFRKHLKKNKEDRKGLLDAGMAARKAQKPTLALTYFDQLINLGPGDYFEYGLMQKAETLIGLDRKAEARTVLEQLIAQNGQLKDQATKMLEDLK